MFSRILAWIREVFNKMIGQSSVKQALKVDIAISAPMVSALQLWSLMYENKATWLNKDIKSLNLPAAIAGEIARAVTIEMTVDISGSARADFLAEQFDKVVPKLREKVEQGAAKGGLMLKPYISNGQVLIDYVQADQFYPVAFDGNGNITSCIFADQRTISDKYYTRLEYHVMMPAGCEITNLAFRSDNRDTLGVSVPLTAVEAWAELQPQATITAIDKPLYAYFRYPLANNIDPSSPLGVSCYSRAVDLIEQADKQWSDLLWEFESGQRAMYVDVLAFGKDKDGKPILPNKRLYRTIDTAGDVGGNNKLFEDWTPTLREVNILNGLDAILRKIEFTCGLAYGTLSNPATIDKTATELKISQQRSYATITDTQKALQNALEQLLYAMDIWATLGNLAPRGTYAANYDFDDSVITDSEVQMQQDRQTSSMGAMPKYIFLMRNYGLDELTAKQWVADNQAETPQVTDLFNGA
jgi:A118 family predicted phage portal protein